MNKTQIAKALKQIEKSKDGGYTQDALIKKYHLNLDLLRFISLKFNAQLSVTELKPKALLNHVINEVEGKATSKAIITKKNLKSLKPWLHKMDVYLKTLKIRQPNNTKSLLHESEKIFTLLNIAVAKLFAHHK
jgi:hypothetical protein